MTVTQLEALRTTLAAWNLRQERARNEYARHPTAACEGVRSLDWRGVLLEFPCEEMATEEQLCRTCQREGKVARDA